MSKLYEILNLISQTLENGGGTFTSTLKPFTFTEATHMRYSRRHGDEKVPHGARYAVALVEISAYEVKDDGYGWKMTQAALNAFIMKLKRLDPLRSDSDNSLGAAIRLADEYLALIGDKGYHPSITAMNYQMPLSFGYGTWIAGGCLYLEAVCITSERDVALLLAALNGESHIYDGFTGQTLRVSDYVDPATIKRTLGAELE